ncbi:MAG: hypothetical protein EI684_17435 [Candidatus Viridilinea halotolerans]|uniref:Uncharacterized protein n=1 Tax=Candidatus Viridilinea halotolerans TaxID=2491704 RepID=A0A426TU30_9CHLR|nr:MAG: hypothetical protein EI684_17435 [Candidatus Viridilinea halotolerans]
MSRFEFVDEFINDYFDVVVEVEFAKQLTPVEVHQLLRRVAEVTSGQLAASLFEGFSYFLVNGGLLRTNFRFARAPQNPRLSGEELENRSRQRVQFIFYFFANISQVSPFASHPFPVGYEAFSSMPEELGFDS